MKENFYIKLKSNNIGFLRLQKPYEEFYKLHGGGGAEMFSEIAVRFSPNSDDKIRLEVEAGNPSQILLVKSGILVELKRIIAAFNHYSIGFSGFDCQVKSLRFHSIDSKPIGYTLPIRSIMWHLIREGYFKEVIIRYSEKNQLFDIRRTNDKSPIIHNKIDYAFPLPRVYEEVICIKGKYTGLAVFGDSTEDSKRGVFEIVIEENYKSRGPNIAILEFDGVENVSHQYGLITQLKDVIDYVYDQGKNLGGIRVNIKIKAPWDKSYSNPIEIKALSWVLKMLLFSQKNFVVEKEVNHIKI